jgi:hypothetical protein
MSEDVCSDLMPPGFQGQVDFATSNLPWRWRYALVVVLAYSRLLSLSVFSRQSMQVLFWGLESAFAASAACRGRFCSTTCVPP